MKVYSELEKMLKLIGCLICGIDLELSRRHWGIPRKFVEVAGIYVCIRPSGFIFGSMIIWVRWNRLYMNRLRTFGQNLPVSRFGLEVGFYEYGDEQGFGYCGIWRVFFWVMDFRLFVFTLTTNTQYPILRNVGLHSPKDAVTPVKTRILRNTAVRWEPYEFSERRFSPEGTAWLTLEDGSDRLPRNGRK